MNEEKIIISANATVIFDKITDLQKQGWIPIQFWYEKVKIIWRIEIAVYYVKLTKKGLQLTFALGPVRERTNF